MQTGRSAPWSVAIGIGLMVIVGCQTENGVRDAPRWVRVTPQPPHELCAVGVSGPTYYQEDAMVRSKAQAMTALSRAWKVKVEAELRIQEREGHRGSGLTIEDDSKLSSDVLLQKVRIKEQWMHPGGNERHGMPGTVYTLACVPK